MRGLPRLAQTYIGFLALVSLYVGVLTASRLPRDPQSLVPLVLLTAGACIAHLFPIFLPRVRAELVISTAVNITIAVVFGAPAAFWSSLFSTAAAMILLRKPWTRSVFNASQLSLTYGAVAFVYHSIWSGPPLGNLWPAIPAAFAMTAVYFFVNSGLVLLIVSLVDRMPFVHLWRLSASRVVIHDLVMVAMGLVFSILWSYNPWTVPLVLPLVLVLYRSMSTLGQMERETKEALMTLAKVVDRRDWRTFAHSERVSKYASWICEQLRLPADEAEDIVYAALLHDLGKVGVPDGLLLKEGKLTRAEEDAFRHHPDIGADIIAQFPIFRRGTDIVRYEHEWYNGAGYPHGLSGDDIPLGSRIIAVADAYEAMITDRPYRKALGHAAAISELEKGKGNQFDPTAVDALIAALQIRRQQPEPSMEGETALSPVLVSGNAEGVDVGRQAAKA